MPSLSIIIPCYHDQAQVSALLQQLSTLLVLPSEVIVVDAASDPVCHAICTQYGAQWHRSDPCRGKQLLQGAQIATGDILWFLHADTRVFPMHFQVLRRQLNVVPSGAIFALLLMVHLSGLC